MVIYLGVLRVEQLFRWSGAPLGKQFLIAVMVRFCRQRLAKSEKASEQRTSVFFTGLGWSDGCALRIYPRS
jgi:hypothetical protein